MLGANDALGTGFFAAGAAAFGAGLVAVEGLRASFWPAGAASSPCLAAEEAVGAVKWDGSRTGRVGERGLGFLNPPGDVVVLSLGGGADEVGLVVVFFASAIGALVLAAALAVVPAVAVDLTGARVVLGAAGLVTSFVTAGFVTALLGAGDLVAVAVEVGFGAVGVLGRGDLGRGLRVELVPRAGDLAVEIVAGFLVDALPVALGVSLALNLLPSTFGVLGPVASLVAWALPPATGAATLGSAGSGETSFTLSDFSDSAVALLAFVDTMLSDVVAAG